MKSAEEILEDANFLRDLIKERNAKGFEAEFYDIKVQSFEQGDKIYNHELKSQEVQKNPSYVGKMTFTLDYPVTEKFLNGMGGVHGASIACWVDIVTSLAIYAFDPKTRLTHVSA